MNPSQPVWQAGCKNPLVPRGKGRVWPAQWLSAAFAQEGGRVAGHTDSSHRSREPLDAGWEASTCRLGSLEGPLVQELSPSRGREMGPPMEEGFPETVSTVM